jgi:hypothetical protein
MENKKRAKVRLLPMDGERRSEECRLKQYCSF